MKMIERVKALEKQATVRNGNTIDLVHMLASGVCTYQGKEYRNEDALPPEPPGALRVIILSQGYLEPDC